MWRFKLSHTSVATVWPTHSGMPECGCIMFEMNKSQPHSCNPSAHSLKIFIAIEGFCCFIHTANCTKFSNGRAKRARVIRVRDGGKGQIRGSPSKSGTYFSGKYHVKFGHFADGCPDGWFYIEIRMFRCRPIRIKYTRRPV